MSTSETTPDAALSSESASPRRYSDDVLSNIVVVLVEPRIAINVGTVMRAMKNMGLTQLRLVNPADIDPDKTQIAAHRTMDVWDQVTLHTDLASALEDVHRAIGLTARPRKREWVVHTPTERAPQILAQASRGERVALVFGRERTGLTNEELMQCEEFLTIPTRPDYASLNLAMAVLLIGYELRQHVEGVREADPELASENEGVEEHVCAPLSHRVRVLAQMEHTLDAIGFFKSKSRMGVVHRLSRILNRAKPDREEARLLTGMFVELIKFAHLVRRGIIPDSLPDGAVHEIRPELLQLLDADPDE